MAERLILYRNGDSQLWTREKAKLFRKELRELFEKAGSFELVIIDVQDIEVFDFSFANELFGKGVLSRNGEFTDKFLAVEHLTDYTRENLISALEGLGLAMLERKGDEYRIIGKLHKTYIETFELIANAQLPLTANHIKDQLNINHTTANERLTKLFSLGLVKREKDRSDAGRDQFIYTMVE
jgi:predicted DNA-binding transcriptional regulator